jgi:hypothetical protein
VSLEERDDVEFYGHPKTKAYSYVLDDETVLEAILSDPQIIFVEQHELLVLDYYRPERQEVRQAKPP